MAKKTNPKQAANTSPKPATTAAKPGPKNTAPATGGTTTGKKMSLVTTLCLALAIISLVVYANTLRNGYVLDDAMVTIKNSLVTQGFKGIPELLVTRRMKGVAYFKNDNYRPLSLVMFAAEFEVFGQKPAVGHFFNIVFFAGCVILLFLFFDKLFDGKKTGVAFVAALLFAVHPMHTEVVANIKSRDEIMCFFFAFWSLNAFLNYMKKGQIWQLLVGTLTLFLSLVSKETSFTLLAIIPLIFFFYRNENRKRAIMICAGMLLAATVFMIIRTVVLRADDCSTTAVEFIDNALVRASLAERFATPILILGKYLLLLIIPYPLIDDYCFNAIPYVGFGNIYVLLSFAVYAFMGVFAIYRFIRQKDDPWAFGIFFYLVTLSLFSNIPFLIGAEMGERFTFYASAGFCLVAALAIEKWLAGGNLSYPGMLKQTPVIGVLAPVALIFSFMTINRNADWKDNYTLFKTDLAKSPNDSRLYFYYGDELIENVFAAEKDPAKQQQIAAESIDNLRKSVSIFHGFTDAHTELGKAFFYANMYDSAIAHYDTAIAQSPYQSIAANNLGSLYMRQGRYRDAITSYLLAIKINAGFGQAFYNLGSCYSQIGQVDSALWALNIGTQLSPGNPDIVLQMGMAYFNARRYDESVPYFLKAISLNPNDVNAVNNLGAAYLNAGKIPQALDMFKKTVAMVPNYVNGYSNMAHCYFTLKQYQACIDNVNKALSLDPKDVKDIPYIALCYKGLGNMEMALKYQAISQQYYPAFKL